MESKTYRDIFQNRKISQDIIDEAKRIVENATKDAEEYIAMHNSQRKDLTKHENDKHTK